MNKGDLVNEVANVVKTKKAAQAAVECVISSITKALDRWFGDDLVIFAISERIEGLFCE
jgi:nucleoid DNA-binding protein